MAAVVWMFHAATIWCEELSSLSAFVTSTQSPWAGGTTKQRGC
jgi:hypothetical protein